MGSFAQSTPLPSPYTVKRRNLGRKKTIVALLRTDVCVLGGLTPMRLHGSWLFRVDIKRVIIYCRLATLATTHSQYMVCWAPRTPWTLRAVIMGWDRSDAECQSQESLTLTSGVVKKTQRKRLSIFISGPFLSEAAHFSACTSHTVTCWS